MARLASFRVAAIADLFRQLRVVSSAVRRRAMDAAETLVADIEVDRNYPHDFVVYRVTGYRSSDVGESTTLVGNILIGDLVTLVQRLSASIELQAIDVDRTPLSMDEVARRLNVSVKTVQRYRRLGLVCHQVEIDGTPRIVCFEDALQRFIDSGRAPLKQAATFTRISDDLQQQMIEKAREMRASQRLSLNETAARLAEAHDRAHETVRQLLRRHDRRSESPIFTERGPLTTRDHRMMFRAHQRGVSASDIAAHVGRSRKAVHRAILRQRGQRLRELKLSYVTLPTFGLDDAQDVLLSPRLVRADLDQPVVAGDALRLLEQSRAWLTLPDADEHVLLGAYNFLKHRAAAIIAALPTVPSAGKLDAAETDLRWAALVKRKLVLHGFAVAIGRVEQNLHQSLATAPRDTILSSIELAAEVACRSIETVDPKQEQRIARVCGYTMERTLASIGQRPSELRAAARHVPDSMLIDDPFQRVSHWQDVIGPPQHWREQLHELEAAYAELLSLHFGWGDTPPMTCAAIARSRETTTSAITRSVDTALAQLRRLSLNAPSSET